MSKTTPKMADLTKGEDVKPKAKATKPAVKKTAIKKAAPKKAVVSKTKSSDLMLISSNEVENLTKDKALKLVATLIESEGMNDFKLGGVLQRIQEEKWWEDGEQDSFRDYCNVGLGIPYRKCTYLIDIYDFLTTAGISYDQVKSITWSKLRYFHKQLTEDNVAEWVKRCSKMNSVEIQEYVKSLLAGKIKKSKNGEEQTTKITSMVFKLHADQRETVNEAIAKAKEVFDTDVAAVALEHICLQFLEGGTGKAKKGKAFGKTDAQKFLGNMEPEAAANFVIAVHPELGEEDDDEDGEDSGE